VKWREEMAGKFRLDFRIVDTPSGRGRYATDSLRTRALRALGPHFEHRALAIDG
jgi:hypothetical protein